jgi:emp24/gp25L/p24 family/GOLD
MRAATRYCLCASAPALSLTLAPALALALAVALALALCAAPAHAVTFELGYGARKCLSEDVPPLANVRGELHVAGGAGDMSLDLFVSNPRGVVYFHKADASAVKYTFKSGAFEAHTTEPYRFCIVHQVHPNSAASTDVLRRVTLTVQVETPASKHAISSLATKDHVAKAQQTFQDVSNEVDVLIAQLDDLRIKEQALSDVNDDTSRTIVRITIIAALFTVATGVLNFLNLKTFFKQKKLA